MCGRAYILTPDGVLHYLQDVFDIHGAKIDLSGELDRKSDHRWL